MLVCSAGVFLNPRNEEDIKDKTDYEKSIVTNIPDDYIVTESINLFVNQNNYIHYDSTVKKAVLEEIEFNGGNIIRFKIESANGDKYEIDYSQLELISTDIIKTKKTDGINEVNIVFRTGQELLLTEGGEIELFKTEMSDWSLDERKHKQNKENIFEGTVEDFVFHSGYYQKGDIYLSHIVIKSDDGNSVELYPYNMDITGVESDGKLIISYFGTVSDSMVFNIEEDSDFAVIISTKEGNFRVKKGMRLSLVMDEEKNYWEIAGKVDNSLYEAEVTGFAFGHTGDEITSIDYIDITLNNGEIIHMTMLQTGADFAVPYGDYKKIYKYDGHQKNLSVIEPEEDWKMEMYYADGDILEIGIGSIIYVYKNDNNIWTIDYKAEIENGEETKEQ